MRAGVAVRASITKRIGIVCAITGGPMLLLRAARSLAALRAGARLIGRFATSTKPEVIAPTAVGCAFQSAGVYSARTPQFRGVGPTQAIGGTMGIHVPLPGSQRELLPNSRGAGPVDPKEIVRLTIRVRSGGNLRDLEQRVQDMATQSLAQRTYLSHDELEAKYGAGKDDLDRVEHYAQEHDLTV